MPDFSFLSIRTIVHLLMLIPTLATPWSHVGVRSECKSAWHQADCEAATNCRWRAKKGKCVDVCQGRTTQSHCKKAGTDCTWVEVVPQASIIAGEKVPNCQPVATSRASVTIDNLSIESMIPHEELLQFHGLSDDNRQKCHNVDETVSLKIASVWAGYLNAEVDWGDGSHPTKHGMNVGAFSSTGEGDIAHTYKEPGLYTIQATAKVRRLNADRTAWETIEDTMSDIIEIRHDCSLFQGTLSYSCEAVEYESGNDGAFVARICFLPNATQTTAYSIDWGVGYAIPLTKEFRQGQEFCRSKLYDEAGYYDVVIKSGRQVVRGGGSVLLDIGASITPTSCSIDSRYIYDASGSELDIAQRINQINKAEGISPHSAGKNTSAGISYFLLVALACATILCIL